MFCGFLSTFRSLVHCEFIFVCGVRVAFQCSQNHLLKRLSFPHWIPLPPLSRINCLYRCGFISGLSVWMRRSVGLFVPVPDCFDHYSFVRNREIWDCAIVSAFFFLKVALAVQGLCGSVPILVFYCSSVKNVVGILIGITLNL